MRRYSRKKNSTKIFIATSLVIAVVAAVSSFFLSDGNEEVVAKVNGQKIFKSELERKLRDVFDGQNQEIQAPEVAKLPKEVIEILAKEVYLEKELTKEAKNSKVNQTKEAKDHIEDVKNKLLRQNYVTSLLKEEITEQRIGDKYAELSNDLAGKKEYSVAHIVVKTKEEAEKLSKDLKSTKAPKFSDLAKKHSIDQDSLNNGGDLGYILEDNMIKEIAEAVVNLKKGEISSPIQTKFGWHLVKLSDTRDAKPLPFESVKDNIREQLTQDKINELNSKIIKDAKIQILIKLETPEEKAADENAAKNASKEAAQQDQGSAENSVKAEENAAPAPEETAAKNDEITLEKADEATATTEETKEPTKSDAKSKNKKTKHKRQ